MHNTLKLLAAAVALCVSPAMAQHSASLTDTVGAGDVTSMLAEFAIKTELRANQAGSPSMLVATTEGGGKFLVGFFDCVDAAKAAGCKQVMVSTAQSSGGVEFDELNAFNGQSSVTTVVYEPSNQILIFGRNIFLPGGIGRDNFKLQVQLFLGDMQKFVEGRKASTKSVAFAKSPTLKTKVTSITADAASTAPYADRLDRSVEVELAIDNSRDVNFTTAPN